MRLVLDEDSDRGNADVDRIADHFAVELVEQHSRSHYARFAVMKRRLRVVGVGYVGGSRGDSRFDVGKFCARMSDRSDYADVFKVFDEVEPALHFGSEGNDLYVSSRKFIVLIERFGSGFCNVLERLRADVFGGNERPFEVNAEHFRALILAFFANVFHVFEGFADILGALRHGRGEKARSSLFRDVFRNGLKSFFGAVHSVRAARAVDMLVDKSGENDTVGFENRLDVKLADRGDFAVLDRDIRFDQTLARDIRGNVFKSFHTRAALFDKSRRGFVADKHAVGMELKNACGNGFGDFALDEPVNRFCFVRAVSHNEDLFRVHNVFKSHGERLTRHFVDGREHTRVVLDRAFGKIDDMRYAAERSTRFVERDMSVRADPEHLNILLHGRKKRVVSVALRLTIDGFAVLDIRVLKIDIDMIEEVVAHKVNVTLIARIVESRVLVEVDGSDLLVARAVFLVVADHILVKPDRGGSRCESENRFGVGFNDGFHYFERLHAHFVVVFCDNDFHFIFSFAVIRRR